MIFNLPRGTLRKDKRSASLVSLSLLSYNTRLLFKKFYLLATAIVGAMAYGLHAVIGLIEHCAEQHKVERAFTQAVIGNLVGTLPNWNYIIYHNEDSQHNFVNEHHNFTELSLHCVGITKGYDIYVFDSGNFTLAGDGGFENWCLNGAYHRAPGSAFVYWDSKGNGPGADG
jgi:hypothetical protein